VWLDLLVAVASGWPGALVLAYSVGVQLLYLTLGLLAFLDARRELHQQQVADRLSLFEGDLAPPISVLVPAHNEEPTIVENIRSLMQLQYPTFEIIVVNDGSKDRTLEVLTQAFGLRRSYRVLRARIPQHAVHGVYSSPDYPFLVVLDVVNGGKAAALNLALAFSRHPLFCAIDADSVLERDTLVRLALPFFFDRRVIATGGVVRPANGSTIHRGQVLTTRLPTGHIARFQVVEYLRGMLAGRMGWNYVDSLFVISGALGLFSREVVLAAGGYRTDTVGEDMELIMRLHRWSLRQGRRRTVRFVGSAVAWTETPASLGVLARQRARWHQGLAESLWHNHSLLTRERFTFAHACAFGVQLFVELLGPILEIAGYLLCVALLITGRGDLGFVLLYLGIWMLGGVLMTPVSIALETLVCPRYRRGLDLAGILIYALIENLGYRQFTAGCRLFGLWRFARHDRTWGQMRRRGHRGQDPIEESTADLSRAA